jgi:hypothetical protein
MSRNNFCIFVDIFTICMYIELLNRKFYHGLRIHADRMILFWKIILKYLEINNIIKIF